MDIVIVYSAMHTGTWFLIRALEAGKLDFFDGVSDADLNRLGRPGRLENIKAEDGITHDWLEEHVLKYFTEEEKDMPIIIPNMHHFDPGCEVLSALQSTKPEIPVAIPMRDPLLTLHSGLWRTFKHPKELAEQRCPAERLGTVSMHVNVLTDLLSLPIENAFLFPIDIADLSNEEYRIKQCQDLYSFCNLEWLEASERFAVNWMPENKSKESAPVARGNHDNQAFSELKQAILDGDIPLIREYMQIEFDFLTAQDNLHYLLERLGYRDLIWW